jgi:hypothetical protein
MKYNKQVAFVTQLAASITTLLGVFYGTTTQAGSLWYAGSLIFWYTLMVKHKMWGLLPLNLATLAVSLYNLYKAFS